MELIMQLKEKGFDCGIAIATNAEVAAGAACGQLSLVVKNAEKDYVGPYGNGVSQQDR